MNKHILLSTDDPGVGGVAQYNHALVCGLKSLGYQVTTLQPKASNHFIDNQRQLGIRHIWFNESTLKNFSDIIHNQTGNIDLLICSNSNPFSNFGVKQIAIQAGIPYIVVEGLVEPHLAEQFSEYLDELSHHYAQAKAVIAVSHDNLKLLHQLFKLPGYQGQVIYYGRPPEYFTPLDLSIRESLRQGLNIPLDAVVCFTAARIETRKGYQYQLEAIKQLINSSIWPQLYFVWVGGGIFEPQLEAYLKDEVQQLGIVSKVQFLGQRSDVATWLTIADIFVFPSELEGMPICVMEAMAKELPVVASAVSGIPEELGSTGKLLPDPKVDPQATIRELVETIQNWATDAELRKSIGQACKQRAEKLFREERMFEETVNTIERALLPSGDYISPGLSVIQPDQHFPNMIIGDTRTCVWPYLRREISHNWYVDRRQPTVGFLSRDEAHILYNTAIKFKGKKALEIGCWLGWSACHLALAGIELDVVDPLLERPDFYESVSNSLQSADVIDLVNLIPGFSPQKVEEVAAQHQRKWSLIFIDGNHDAPGPLEDAIACEQLAEEDAIVLFHDLASPDVAQGLDYFKHKGWNTMVYQTMQIMGVAWRGNVEPVQHQPDPCIHLHLPEHLKDYSISFLSESLDRSEFQELLTVIRPYTLLSEARLFSLYSLAKQICLKDIPGNFVECGTYKGGSAALLAAVIQRYSSRSRLLYAFDTFEGMPAPIDVDRHNGVPANLTGYGEGTLKAPIGENLNVVCNLLNVQDIVITVQGLFSQTLPQYKLQIGNIAFLHADGDWYGSTMDIFKTLFNNIDIGGIIQVDDYGHWEGCRKAIHDFEKQRGESFCLQKIDDTGVWFHKEQHQLKAISNALVIDAIFFQLYNTGIARVWRSLLEEWARNGFAKHIVVLDRAGTAPKISGIRYREIPPYDYNNTNADREMLQHVCDEEGADLFISTYYTTPISTPSVIMIHDMIPEVFGADLNQPMWREKHYGIQHASAYIAISENTARDLVRFFPDISPESITVAHCGVQALFSPASPEEISRFKAKYGITKPYFMLAGAGSGQKGSYKNTMLFFQAFSKLFSRQGLDIVCTGSGLVDEEIRTYTAGSAVHTLVLEDEELKVAYSGAVALVYPSKYEGFGLPVLEALACGCPVITCPNASIPEVAGEAALYVNDNDVNGLANALCEVQKPEVRNSLVAAGLEQARKFSWAIMADQVSSVLINTTLQSLKLRDINLIIFPDWSQPEETLLPELQEVIQAIARHMQKGQMTLLIDTSGVSAEDADMAVSSVAMNLMLESDLDVSEGPEISLLPQLSKAQWQALLPRLKGRIRLECDSPEAIAESGAGEVAVIELDNLSSESDLS